MKPMADNITLQEFTASSGTYTAGTTMATKQNADLSHSQRVVVDNVPANQPVTVTNTVPISRADDFYNDAFQRLRTSDPDPRFDINFKYDKQPLIFDEITAGGGQANHDPIARDVVLSVGDTVNASRAAICQRWYNVYTPGDSQFVIITGTLNAANLAGGTAEFFLRSNVTGTLTEVTQDITAMANWQYSQIFVMDFQSLDVGRIRYALDRDGLVMELGEISNDNKRETAYWQNPSLPICYDVFNTATESVTEFRYGDAENAIGFRFRVAADANHYARAICSSVKSEGGGGLLDLDGFPFTAGNGATTKTVSTTLIPLASIQLKTTFNSLANRGLVLPQAYSFQTDQPIFYEIRVNATLTNASFASVSADSLVNVDVAATAVTGGRVIASGYIGAGGQRAGGTEKSITSKIPLSVNYAGTAGDVLTVCAIRTSAQNASAGVTLEWREIR
jgi:hypothetical protein